MIGVKVMYGVGVGVGDGVAVGLAAADSSTLMVAATAVWTSERMASGGGVRVAYSQALNRKANNSPIAIR